jgi:hypothetical protein
MEIRILFTGHMIDAASRTEPRFPAKKEQQARNAIKNSLKKINAHGKDFLGIAGGACGGDILFHELCMELNIPSEIFLALPANEFKKESVSFAGKEWEQRFDQLIAQLPSHILPQANEEANVWERANTWMLDEALKNGGSNMALIALWNLKGGDGTGGTEHMVNIAKEQKSLVEIININNI